MNCSQAREGMSEYIDGVLEPARRAELEAHLKQCAACSEQLAELRKTVALLDEAYAGLAVDTAEFAPRAAQRARSAAPTRGRSIMDNKSTVKFLLKLAAVLLVVAGAAAIFWMTKTPPPETKPPGVASVERKIEPVGIGQVAISRGAVGVRSETQPRWTLAKADRPIEPKDIVRVGGDPLCCARITLGSGVVVSLNSSTAVQFAAKDHVRVFSGDAHFKVPSGTAFTAETPQGSITAKGTAFDVTVVPGSTKLAVTDGAVVLSALDQKFDVTPGRSCEITGRQVSWGDAPGVAPWLAKLEDRPVDETIGRLLAKIDGKEVPLTVKSHKVTVTIRDQIAYTLIDEEFENNTDRRLEGTFYYPLPADSSISRFAMYIGETLMEGEVVERMRAREVYESIVRQRRDPALLEWMGGNQFKARVFPIEARSTKRVLIGYTQILPLEGDLVRYTYPLKSEKLTKNPLAYLKIELDAYSTPTIADFDSPTHACRVKADEHHGTLSFEASDYVPTRDFLASFRVTGTKAELYSIAHWREDDNGYFLAFISPRNVAAMIDSTKQGEATNVMLMIDTSASMAGDNFKVARRVAATYLNFLGEKDRFNVLLYDVTARPLFPQYVENTQENRQKVSEALEGVAPLGASNLGEAFNEAAAVLGDKAQILYIGDGRATMGITQAAGLLQAATTALGGRHVTASVFVIGTEYDQAFVDGFARQFGGVAKIVSSARPIEEIVSEMVEDSFKPLLTELQLLFEGVEVREVYPRVLPNVLVGGQIIVAGRYEKPGAGTMILAASAGTESYRREIETVLPGEKGPNTFVPRLWARRAMDDMLNRIERGQKDLVKAVIDLSIQYKLMSPYTSMLVLETEEDYKRFGIDRRFEMEQWTGGAAGPERGAGPEEMLKEAAAKSPMSAMQPVTMAMPDWDAGGGDLYLLGDEFGGVDLGLGLSRGTTRGELRAFEGDEAFSSYGAVHSLTLERLNWGDSEAAGEVLDLKVLGTDGLSVDFDGPVEMTQERSAFEYAMPVDRETTWFWEGNERLSESGAGASGRWRRGTQDGRGYAGRRRREQVARGNSIYPVMYVQPPQTEPQPPQVDDGVRKVLEAFAGGPIDFSLHSVTTHYSVEGKVAFKEEAKQVLLGKKFIQASQRDGSPESATLCDGELYCTVYENLNYAAARRTVPQDVLSVAQGLPGMVGYSVDGFLTSIGVPKIESREGDVVVLLVERGNSRSRYFVDTARKVLTKVERYHRDNANAEFKLSSSTVYEDVKPIGARAVPTRVRTLLGEGKLGTETVYDKLELGEIKGDFAFAPPANMLVAVYPLPSSADAKKALDAAAKDKLVQASFVLALSLEQERKWGDAATALQPVIDARPDDPYVVLFQGWLQTANGDPNALPKASEKAEKLMKERYQLYNTIYNLMGSAGLHNERQKYVQVLFDLAPKDSSDRVNWASQLANSYINSNQPQKGYEVWRTVLEEAPGNSYAWQQAAQYYQNRPEWAQQAEAAYLKARELGQDVDQSLAYFYQNRGEWDKARAAWHRSFDRSIYSWNFRQYIEALANDMGPEAAVKEAEAYLASVKDTQKFKQAMLGYMYWQREEPWGQDTSGICKRLQEAFPDDSDVLRELVQCFNNYNSTHDPTPAVEKLLAAEPQDQQAALKQLQLVGILMDYGNWRDMARDWLAKLPPPKFAMTPEQQADYLYALGNVLQSVDPPRAIETWQKVLTLELPANDPRRNSTRSQTFNVMLNTSDTVGARKLLDEAAKATPPDGNLPGMRQRLLTALRQQKKTDELIGFLGDLQKTVPSMEYYCRHQIAALQAGKDKPQEAYDELWAMLQECDAAMKAGTASEKNEAYYFYQASRTLIRLTAKDEKLRVKFDEAVAARASDEKPDGDQPWATLNVDLLRARRKYPEMTAQMEKLAQTRKNADTWLRRIASAYAATKSYDKAEAIYQKLVKQDPTDTASLMQLMKLAEATKQPSKARDYWEAWLAAVPNDESLLYSMAGQLANRNETAKAIAVYEKLLGIAVKVKPQNFVQNLVNLYVKQDRKLDAAMAYVKATRPVPGDRTRPYELLGSIWTLITEEVTFNKLVAAVEKEIAESNEPPRQARLMCLLVDVYNRRGDPKTAAAWGEKAIGLARSLDEATFDVALNAVLQVAPPPREEQPPDAQPAPTGWPALSLVRKAVDDAGADAPVWLRVRLGRVLFSMKQPAAGERIFREVIEAAPATDKPRLTMELANLIGQDDPVRAVAILDEVAKMADHRMGAQALRRKADLMAAAKTYPAEEVLAAYRAAASTGTADERRNALEAMVGYATQAKQHEAVIEGYQTLCRMGRGNNPSEYMRRLGEYLRANRLEDRAEPALRGCVRSANWGYRGRDAWIQFGQYFIDRGEPDKAVHIYAEGLAATPASGQLEYLRHDLVYRVCSTFMNGNKDKVDRQLVTQVILDEMDRSLKTRRRSGYGWPSQYWDAARELGLTDQLVAKAKAVPEGDALLGDVYRVIADMYRHHLKQPDMALKYYKMALDSKTLQDRYGVLEQMMSIYGERKDWQAALDCATEAARQDQGYYRKMQQAYYLAKLGKADEALKAYQEAAAGAGRRQYDYGNHRQVGTSAFEAGMYDFAIKELNFALRLHNATRRGNNRDDNHVSECHRYIAKCYMAQGDTEKAVDQLLIGLTQLRQDYRGNLDNELMAIYRDSGKLDELVAKYEREAEATKIERPALRVIFGDVYRQKGNEEAALKQYYAALADGVAPNRSDYRKRVIEILRKGNRTGELIEQYRQWAKYEPKNLQVYRELGDLFKQTGRSGEAMRAYSTMLEAMPTEADSHREMAGIYAAMSRWADAISMWKKVVEYRPEEPQSYYGLAEGYTSSKQPQLAVEVYRDMLTKTWDNRFGDVKAEADRRLRSIEATSRN